MKKRWWIGILLLFFLVIGGFLLFFILSYFLYTSRIPDVGDVFVYTEQNGMEAGQYEIRVTKRDSARKILTFTGTPRGSSFYTLLIEFSYSGKYLEIVKVQSKNDESFTCDIVQGKRGFFFSPIKRIFRRVQQFGFRAVCEAEGSIAFADHMEWAKKKDVKVPAGIFDAYPISHRVTYPFQEEEEGRGTFYFSPELGFLVKFEIVEEGFTYRFALASYQLQKTSGKKQ